MRPPFFEYTLPGGKRRRRRLVAAPCAARCGRRTLWHPLCTPCAAAHAGVAVRASTVPGAGRGLFAVRDLPGGLAVGPYTGDAYPNRAALAAASGGAAVGPYAVQLRPGGPVVDGAVRRPLVAMVNEPPRGAPVNAILRVGRCTTARGGPLLGSGSARGPWRRCAGAAARARGVRWVPAVYGDSPRCWLVTTRPVPRGAELFVCYHNRAIRSAVHRTVYAPVHGVRALRGRRA